MEAEVIDSLWEIGRQEDGFYHNKIAVTRFIWQEGQYGVYNLFFNTIDEVIAYFNIEEVGDGLYDSEDRVIIFSYDQPTGPLDRLYAFFRDESFDAVVAALGNQLTQAELDIDISRKVIDDLDPGFRPPAFIIGEATNEELPDNVQDITLQDYTDADLRNFNRLISTDLNREPFGTTSPAIVTPNYLKPSNENQLSPAIPSLQRSTKTKDLGTRANGCSCKKKTNNPLTGEAKLHLIKSNAYAGANTRKIFSTKTKAFSTKANGYSSPDVDVSPLQTIRDESSEILFNEYEHLAENHGEKEPGGIAPRPDLSLGVAELRDDPHHPSLVGRQLSLAYRQQPLPERNLLNTPSFRSWQL